MHFKKSLLSIATLLLSQNLSASIASDGYSSYVEALYWYPSQENSNIWVDRIGLEINGSYWDAISFSWGWDLGFRLGCGYNQGCLSSGCAWTHFYTQSKESVASLGADLSPEFDAAFLAKDIYGLSAEGIAVAWSLSFDMIDWHIAREFSLKGGGACNLYTGLKGGRIFQKIHAHYTGLTETIFPDNGTGEEALKNDFKGVGPLVGVELSYPLFREVVSCCGNFSCAALWGHWECSDRYQDSFSHITEVVTPTSVSGTWMGRAFVGVLSRCQFFKRGFLEVELGYEAQIWFNQLRIATFQLQRLHGDLTLEGVTLKCALHF